MAVPATYGPYDAEVQKKLIRAEKKKILEDLKEDEAFKTGNSYMNDKVCALISFTINFRII